MLADVEGNCVEKSCDRENSSGRVVGPEIFVHERRVVEED